MAYYEGMIGDIGCCNNGNNNGSFGDGDWIWAFLLFALLGNGAWGGFGGGRGYGASPATQADLSAGFANSEIMSDLNDILLGQASMQNFINQGFSGLNATVTNGFAGVNNAICTLGYQNAQLINGLSRELGDCCCATQRAIDSVKLENERNTCSIINAANANTRAILDFLTTEKISALQAENSGLKAQISNDKQSAYLISQLREPCPVPAYLTCDPRVPYNYNPCGCTSVQ